MKRKRKTKVVTPRGLTDEEHLRAIEQALYHFNAVTKAASDAGLWVDVKPIIGVRIYRPIVRKD